MQLEVNTVVELKKLNLSKGDIVKVLGYYSNYDGAEHKRIISDTDNGSGIKLDNGLYGNVICDGEVKVNWFGAKGDGVTDDTEAFKRAFNTKVTVNLSRKNYIINSTLFLNKYQVLKGNGAVISTNSDVVIIKCSDNNIIENLFFENSQVQGIAIDFTNGFNNMINNVQIKNYKKGLLFGRSVGNHSGNQITNLFVNKCEVGIYVDVRGEFSTFTNCTLSENQIALKIIGGNTHFVGGNICNNEIGVEIGKGENDAHGLIAATSIKHNTKYAIVVDSPNVGEFLFEGISLYYGDIYLKDCKGIYFSNSTIDAANVFEENVTECKFKDINFFNKPIKNIPNYNNSVSSVLYENVRGKE